MKWIIEMKMNLWENASWEGILLWEAKVKVGVAGTDSAWDTIVLFETCVKLQNEALLHKHYLLFHVISNST